MKGKEKKLTNVYFSLLMMTRVILISTHPRLKVKTLSPSPITGMMRPCKHLEHIVQNIMDVHHHLVFPIYHYNNTAAVKVSMRLWRSATFVNVYDPTVPTVSKVEIEIEKKQLLLLKMLCSVV